jgi:two-component system, OmpR family, sensor kinase
MASLRARLIAGLLVVAAAGLVALAAITYAEQRSFLLDRVDQQARNASPAISHALDEAQGVTGSGAGARGGVSGGGAGLGTGGANGARLGPGGASDAGRGAPAGRDRGPGGAPPPRGDGDEGPSTNLPPGTYGERRDASGKRIGQPVVLSYGETAPPAPRLPARLPEGRLLTVKATGGSDLRYRVLAKSEPFSSGTTVVAVPLREVDQTLSRLALVEALVIGAILLAMGLVAFLVVRLGLRPLDRMGDTAGAIAGGDLSRRVSPATPKTEVGRLGLALNAMLGRLEEAFAERQASEDRLRRFLADASHELRTPLSSIRGYAELHRIGALDDPGEAERAMRRIEDEAARMGVLVEDLLTLARLDEVRDPVRDDVDLVEIAKDAVEDARATAPERAIELTGEGPAIVPGDSHQLRQVIANLLRNALVHTPAGTPIHVSAGGDGDQARLEVRDHGPGLPDGDTDALFDRFWRAEGGRVRGRAGAGLGLAIVAAIVAAHGGSVSAANAAGGGAAFAVRLPARTAGDEGAGSAGAGDPPGQVPQRGDAAHPVSSLSA